MKNIVAAVAAIAASVAAAFAAPAPVAPFKEGERVLFFGDSITHNARYVADLQFLLDLRRPGLNVTIMDAGVAGDTAEGGLRRLEWDVLERNPDRVFVMFGMNDVGHSGKMWMNAQADGEELEQRSRTVARYAANMAEIVRRLKERSVAVVLMTPTPYDEYLTAEDGVRKGVNEPFINSIGLASLAVETRRLAASEGLGLVELYWPMTDFLVKRAKSPLMPDRVHPGDEGHFMMASLILEAVGEGKRAPCVLDASKGVRIFEYAPKGLPYPSCPALERAKDGLRVVRDAMGDRVSIRGLEDGHWRLLADGRHVGTFPARALSDGIDIAALDTPMHRAAKALEPMRDRFWKAMNEGRTVPAQRLRCEDMGGRNFDDEAEVFAKCDEFLASIKAKGYSSFSYHAKNVENFKKLYPRRREVVDLENSLRTELSKACRAPKPCKLSIEKLVEVSDVPPAPPSPEDWRFREELAKPVAADAPAPPSGKPWLRHRISRCYFSPIKRAPFFRDELMDDVDYYPDGYLDRLSREGVNGIWISVELRDLVETSFGPRPKDAPRRIAKLRRTVEKCARHGIRVWPFCIEPRFVDRDDPLVAERPGMFSAPDGESGMRLLCPSTAEGRRYLEEASEDLFRQVPGLPGILNLSHGERPTTCLSTVSPLSGEPARCPRCSSLRPAEIHRLAAEALLRGMRRIDPEAELLSWFYQPHVRSERAAWVADVAGSVPDGVTMLYNFESGAVKEQLGRCRAGGDYWQSYTGPSDAFRRVADAARAAGTSIGAKIQVACSHECATIPYVPAPGLLYRKYRAMKDSGCSSVMQCWYFGNHPGVMNRAAGELAFSDFTEDEDGFLMRLASVEWGEDAETMTRIWRAVADAYSEYPMSNDMQYYGPFHAGIAWPLFAKVAMKPLARTWKPHDPPSGDVIGECLENHSLDEAAILASRMKRSMARATPDIARISAKYAGNPERIRDIGVVRAFALLVDSASSIFDFYLHRSRAVAASRVFRDPAAAKAEIAEMRNAAKAAKRATEEMLPLARADSRIGFHSEAEIHQFHPAKLEWRLAALDATLAEIDEIEAALRQGEAYPLSSHERGAPAMNCGAWTETSRRFVPRRSMNSELDVVLEGSWETADGCFRFRLAFAANGDFVIAGEIPDRRPVEISTLDACGASWPKSLSIGPDGKVSFRDGNVVTPSHEVRSLNVSESGGGWTFRLQLDASGWGWDKSKRPAWILIRSDDAPIWPELDPSREERLNIGNVTPDLFGRIIE